MPNHNIQHSLHQFSLYLHNINNYYTLKMFTPEVWQWIYENKNSDVNRLRLAAKGDKIRLDAIDQIECRRRTRTKLYQTLQCETFYFPGSLSAEQCTSDDIAAFHASLIDDNCFLLDMTCGLGIDDFHFARKAQKVHAIELFQHLVDAAQYNSTALKLTNFEIEAGDSSIILGKMPDNSYDYIFIDPARRGANGKKLFAVADCSPDVTHLIDEMLRVAPVCIIKLSPMLDITHTLRELNHISKIIAVGTRSECKELVAICTRAAIKEPLIEAATVISDYKISIICFTQTDEKEADASYRDPKIDDYLLIPYPAVMKAAPFNLLCNRFALSAVSPDSHLYVSETLRTGNNIPGKTYKVVLVVDFDKKGVKILREKIAESGADVTVRDFTLSAEQLISKLRCAGSNKRLVIGTRTLKRKHILILCESIDANAETSEQ